MKLNLLILAFIVIGISGYTYFADTSLAPQNVEVEKIDDFGFITLAGSEGSLYDYEGHVIFVHFWATWCAPCVTELPQLIDLAKARPNNFTILAVAVDNKPVDIKRFIAKYSLPENFIIALDPDKSISSGIFGTKKLPETFILRPNVSLYEKIVGSEDHWNNEEWRVKIDNLKP